MSDKIADATSVYLTLARCDQISSADAALCRDVMSDQEWARNQRYRFERDRHRDLVARGLLRMQLAQRLAVEPHQLNFAQGEHGKPELINDHRITVPADLHFNLSHAGEWVVLAIASHRVGVDIEFTPRNNDVMAIANRYFFGSEIKELHGFPEAEQKLRFFDYWTLKEAYMKARGEGISLGLDNFGFSVADPKNIRIYMKACLNDSPSRWQFFCTTPEPDYRFALAINTQAPVKLHLQQCIPFKQLSELQWNTGLY